MYHKFNQFKKFLQPFKLFTHTHTRAREKKDFADVSKNLVRK